MFKGYLEKVVRGENLNLTEMEDAMNQIMEGEISPIQMAGFLVGLRSKGETITEITGAAKVMRDKAVTLNYNSNYLVDTCGTGGDGKGTFNISTTVAFVLAAAGLTVAKHGNRSVSSKSGSADVLEQLGVNISLSPDRVRECVEKIGIGFLFAPTFHRAMKHAVKPRRQLGLRTIFNVLGPLTNPARAQYQIMGVYDQKLVQPLAEVLKNLGVKSAMVVHGADGIDEFSTTGENTVAYLNEGRIKHFHISPAKAGLPQSEISDLKGGSPAENKEIMLSIFRGEKGPRRDTVLFNAAAALIVTGKVETWQQGIELAADIIDRKKALEKLEELIDFTNSMAVVS